MATMLLVACADDGAAAEDTSSSSDGDDTTTSPPTTTSPTTTTATTADTSESGASETTGTPADTSGTADDTTTADSSGTDTSASSESTGDGSSSSDDGSSSSETTAAADVTAPIVTIASPLGGGAVLRPSVEITGTASDDVGVAALVHDGPDGEVDIPLADDGSFAATLALLPGTNAVTLRARDLAGNEGSADVDVHYGHRITVGNSQSAMLRDGMVYTWGRNELGQLGNGTLEGSGYGDDPVMSMWPVRYELDVAGVVSVITRQTFMIALVDDGTVMTWGSNSSGQLGYDAETDCGSQGTSPCRRVPTAVPDVSGAIAVQAGYEHALVLLDDGTVTSWGDNDLGQLGHDGPSTPVPAVIDGLGGVVQLAASSHASLALGDDGTVWTWGDNGDGQLGLGVEDDQVHAIPTAVAGVTDAIAIAAANTTAYALLDDGTVLAWGRNHAGQAGNGLDDGAVVLVPTPVVRDEDGAVLDDVVAIAADGFVALARTGDGTVYAWGLGGLGQLGQGYLDDGARDLVNRFGASPVAVDPADVSLFDITEIEIGAGGPGLALARSGDLFGWGWSFRGSLGLEGAIDAWAYSAPVVVFAAP